MSTAEAKTAMNLNELADYIESNISQDQIDMEDYFKGQPPSHVLTLEDNDDDATNNVDCETVACALGHATSVFPIKPEHFLSPDMSFDFDIFGKYYFPALYNLEADVPEAEMWLKVFGSHLDPDKEKVVRRLRDMAKYLVLSTYPDCD